MNYVNSLNLFGVPAKEIPCIKFEGAPTESTVGAVGLLGMDTLTGDVWKCISESDGNYTWENIVDDSGLSVLSEAKDYTDDTINSLVEDGGVGRLDRTPHEICSVEDTWEKLRYGDIQINEGFALVPGEEYTVAIAQGDHIESYTRRCKETTNADGDRVCYVGNPKYVTYFTEGTREPFAIIQTSHFDSLGSVWFEYGGGIAEALGIDTHDYAKDDIAKLTITQNEIAIRKIDAMYLPYDIIDLGTYGIAEILITLWSSGGGVRYLSDENTNAFWNAVASAGPHCVFKIDYEGPIYIYPTTLMPGNMVSLTMTTLGDDSIVNILCVISVSEVSVALSIVPLPPVQDE